MNNLYSLVSVLVMRKLCINIHTHNFNHVYWVYSFSINFTHNCQYAACEYKFSNYKPEYIVESTVWKWINTHLHVCQFWVQYEYKFILTVQARIVSWEDSLSTNLYSHFAFNIYKYECWGVSWVQQVISTITVNRPYALPSLHVILQVNQ